MYHRRHVQFHHLFIKRVPPFVGERWICPVTSRGIRIEVAAYESKLFDAALKLADAGGRWNAGRLRKLAHADKILGVQRANPVYELIADTRPGGAGNRIADMMSHRAGYRREDGKVGAALALGFDLGVFQAFAYLVVADFGGGLGIQRRIHQRFGLLFTIIFQRLGGGGVMPVTVDNHG